MSESQPHPIFGQRAPNHQQAPPPPQPWAPPAPIEPVMQPMPIVHHDGTYSPDVPGTYQPTLRLPCVMTTPVARHSTVAHIIFGVVSLLTLGAAVPLWITYAVAARRRTLRVTLDQAGMLTAAYD